MQKLKRILLTGTIVSAFAIPLHSPLSAQEQEPQAKNHKGEKPKHAAREGAGEASADRGAGHRKNAEAGTASAGEAKPQSDTPKGARKASRDPDAAKARSAEGGAEDAERGGKHKRAGDAENGAAKGAAAASEPDQAPKGKGARAADAASPHERIKGAKSAEDNEGSARAGKRKRSADQDSGTKATPSEADAGAKGTDKGSRAAESESPRERAKGSAKDTAGTKDTAGNKDTAGTKDTAGAEDTTSEKPHHNKKNAAGRERDKDEATGAASRDTAEAPEAKEKNDSKIDARDNDRASPARERAERRDNDRRDDERRAETGRDDRNRDDRDRDDRRAGGPAGGFLAPTKARSIEEVRRDRREVVEGDRTFIREPGRTIVKDGSRTFIVHDEVERFRNLGYDVQRRREGRNFVDIIQRPGGEQILSYTDDSGRLLRRVRRDRDGREVVLVTNVYDGRPRSFAEDVVVLAPPPLRIPRERYIVDYRDADASRLYEALSAPPVAALPKRYTLDQVRYSPDVRNYVRSVDINTINFETASWEVPQAAAGKLDALAAAIKKTVDRNPNSVFLIEGYTDAVGNATDNLSLSDRRAQSVAAILTKEYNVPPENLTTQGYGEQNPKEQTDGPSAANRRVVVRNVTQLLAANGERGRGEPER